jgi:uroporphyrin-III C-methyltransferase/precorrin-2 dehydrogenase/sirohydrochlorin ferrochelatase
MHPYLLGLRLEGRRVVVVGGGAVASRRVPALLDAGAEVLLVSPKVAASLEDLAAAGRIRWEARAYRPGDCAGAWLVCACTDDPAVNAAVAAAAEHQLTWCVRADDAAASAAWTPASGQAGDVRVGVLSGDPRHSAGLRDAIVDGVRSGALSARHGRKHPAGVAIIGGGPGDPGLITVRGRQLLAEADVVLTDRLAPRSLLDELRDDVEVIDAGKIPYGRAMAQEHINAALVSHAQAGRFVARLKGGDPFVFGRGAEEVLACLRAGIPVTVVPGVTSAVGVPASAWVPVTHRGVAQEFSVVSVHVPPGDERSTVNWELLGGSSGTLVLMMAVERIGTVANELLRYGRSPDTPVSVIADGTLPTQRTINSTLEEVESRVAEEGVRPPAIVVVGDVVSVATEITELMRHVSALRTGYTPRAEAIELVDPRPTPRDPEKPLTGPQGFRGSFERTLQRWKVRAWQRHRRLPADRASPARARSPRPSSAILPRPFWPLVARTVVRGECLMGTTVT